MEQNANQTAGQIDPPSAGVVVATGRDVGGAGTRAACQAVLETTELLEMILLHLGTMPFRGTKTLLLSQRVNRRFKSVIDGSDELQQALFFKRAVRDGTRFGVEGVNPLLIKGGITLEVDQRTRGEEDYDVIYGLWCEKKWKLGDETPGYAAGLNRYNEWKPEKSGSSRTRMYPFQTPFKWRTTPSPGLPYSVIEDGVRVERRRIYHSMLAWYTTSVGDESDDEEYRDDC